MDDWALTFCVEKNYLYVVVVVCSSMGRKDDDDFFFFKKLFRKNDHKNRGFAKK